jgi:hypothetical protein
MKCFVKNCKNKPEFEVKRFLTKKNIFSILACPMHRHIIEDALFGDDIDNIEEILDKIYNS